MKKLALLTFLTLLFVSGASAQNTAVSATITDGGGQAWLRGTYSFTFRPSPLNTQGPYFLAGAPFNINTTISGNLDNTGSFSGVVVPSNTSITPAGSLWTVQVCPAATVANGCYVINLTISGATQNISSAVIPPTVQVSLSGGNAAYSDSEIIGAHQGSFYSNLTDGTVHYCSTVPPCTWVPLTGGGGVNPGTTGQIAIYTASNTVGADTNLDDGNTLALALTYKGAAGLNMPNAAVIALGTGVGNAHPCQTGETDLFQEVSSRLLWECVGLNHDSILAHVFGGTALNPNSLVMATGTDIGSVGDSGILAANVATLAGVQSLSNKTLSTAPVAGGTAAGLTGTGACATITTQTGGSWAGSAKCTGTTGASTLTITPGTTAPNGWVCDVWDETTRANSFQQTSHTATTCVLTATSVTSNDLFVFKAVAF